MRYLLASVLALTIAPLSQACSFVGIRSFAVAPAVSFAVVPQIEIAPVQFATFPVFEQSFGFSSFGGYGFNGFNGFSGGFTTLPVNGGFISPGFGFGGGVNVNVFGGRRFFRRGFGGVGVFAPGVNVNIGRRGLFGGRRFRGW
jgi:hypothetical protein